jgi:hypothetical protein
LGRPERDLVATRKAVAEARQRKLVTTDAAVLAKANENPAFMDVLRCLLLARVTKAERCPRLARAEGERMILPRLGEAGRLICQVICQLMGTVSGGLRF